MQRAIEDKLRRFMLIGTLVSGALLTLAPLASSPALAASPARLDSHVRCEAATIIKDRDGEHDYANDGDEVVIDVCAHHGGYQIDSDIGQIGPLRYIELWAKFQ